LGLSFKELSHHQVAARLKEYDISGILFIGGFEAFSTVLGLAENRAQYPEFRIPMVILPATIRSDFELISLNNSLTEFNIAATMSPGPTFPWERTPPSMKYQKFATGSGSLQRYLI
jgi:hypothetical protein